MNADNVIAAFSEEHAERLTGITKSQLRYWDRTRFFVPSYADDNRRAAFSRIYSFRDIAALRVINVLRNQNSIPLQHLRKVAEKLAHLADNKWTGTTLWVVGKRVLFQGPGDPRPKEIVSGQFHLDFPLKKVVSATQRDVKRLLARPAARVGAVEQSRYVNHNAWVVAGTRIPTRAIRRFHEAGYTVPQIIKEYPDLTAQDVDAALTHERKLGNVA
jgi:DNA-binding transcriptional MerR regulator